MSLQVRFLNGRTTAPALFSLPTHSSLPSFHA
jgi:hypothetical protein